MKLKSDVHEKFPLLFKRDGVPPNMIIDHSKEQLSSDFIKKLFEANCHQKIIKPHSPWSTAYDMNIHIFKRSCYQNMIKTKYQNHLWDHCDELEARIRPCTAH